MIDYLVTGGAGFIGSNIVRAILELGRSVRVLDNLSTGRLRNIEAVQERVDVVVGDIRDAETVARAVSGVQNVLHLAALPSVVASVEDPVTSDQVNACGTLGLLVASRDAGVRRFVFSSSAAVYGEDPVLPKREDMVPAPLSPYAIQKLSGEYYCKAFFNLYGLETFCLRYFNVFGPRQNPKSQYGAAVPLFIDALRENRSPTVFGDGEQTRDFIYVEDVARANLRCCEAGAEAVGQVYNVARGGRMSINELIGHLKIVMGKDLEPVYAPARSGDIRHSQADVSRSVGVLGWEPRTDMRAGFDATVRYFMEEDG